MQSEFHHLYKPALTEIVFHEDDPDLDTIRIPLPLPPPIQTIDGYGKHPKEQFWKPPGYPRRLKDLESKFKTIDEIRDFLESHQTEYEQEIKFIEKQWENRHNGYWCFIDGRPTYITGWHTFYLSWWHLDTGLPQYRSRDWKWFHFMWWAYNDTKLPDGTDLKRRICAGVNYPKARREGGTYRAECINFLMTTSFFNARGGISSMTGKAAKDTFQIHLVAPFKRLPFFMKPMTDSASTPKSEIVFDVPTVRKGAMSSVEFGLGGKLDFAESASGSAYDGKKLIYWHSDEVGKTVEENVFTRWQIIKKCLSTGNGVKIHGFSIGTSTVGEMAEGGGKNFFDLCSQSHYSQRNKLGQTNTGLYNLFIPSWDCLEGFTDIFGNGIIEDPTEDDLWRWRSPVWGSDGKLIGSKSYLLGNRESLLLEESQASLQKYEEEVRQFPISFSECFIQRGAGSGLNLKKITIRLKDVQMDTTITKRVNYEWENGKIDTKVVQKEDPNGRWVISLDLQPNRTNQRIQKQVYDEVSKQFKVVWSPKGSSFVGSADPFRFARTEGNRLSQAATSIFWPRDYDIDPIDKPMSLWESNRMVVTYKNRPATGEEFAEDVLMMCVFWGSLMYPEINVPVIWDHFVKRGYDGYLLYGTDTQGRKKSTPGVYATAGPQQQLFQFNKDYIENHCHRERHLDYLLEAKSIKGIEDLHNYDLFTSVGYSLMGAEHLQEELIVTTSTSDIKSYFGVGRKY